MVEALRAEGLRVWFDLDSIQPGTEFSDQIERALRSADAILFFVSESTSKSEQQLRELDLVIQTGAFVIPVAMGRMDVLLDQAPQHLRNIQWLRVQSQDEAEIRHAVKQISSAIAKRTSLEGSKNTKKSALSDEQLSSFAEHSASEFRDHPIDHDANPQSAVFLVHGHDLGLKDQVSELLLSWGIRPIVLSDIEGGHKSILQKFMLHAQEARFAVVLISADDRGASNREFNFAGAQTLKYRARQNVILELGFFYGRLDWENVFVLQKEADDPWPSFERPSDLNGIDFNLVDHSNEWQRRLRNRLQSAGLISEMATPQ